MRLLWEPSGSEYLRDFLVCGPFVEPATPRAPAGSEPSTAPTVTQPTAPVDYLAAAGGEPNVRPQEGQTVTVEGGAGLAWRAYSSEPDLVDLAKAVPAAAQKPCVVYAYATIHRDGPTQAVLWLYTRAPMAVYLNGKVVLTVKERTSGTQAAVSLEKGATALLIRAASSGGMWRFSLAVTDQLVVPTDDPALLRASIMSGKDGADELAVKVGNDNRLAPATVTLEVLAPAGKVVARAQVPLGQTHTFATARWADGPYEIRALSRTPEGVPLTRYLLWHKGDWKQEVAAVFKEAEGLSADSDDPVVLKRRLLCEVLQICLGGKDPHPSGWLARPTPRASRWTAGMSGAWLPMIWPAATGSA